MVSLKMDDLVSEFDALSLEPRLAIEFTITPSVSVSPAATD
jgi:hypothetical protein